MTKEQALNTFWNNFGLQAFDENTVPEYTVVNGEVVKLTTPYITYQVAISGSFETTQILNASLWYRSTSWQSITEKATEIYNYIGDGGRMIKIDGGYMWIRRSSTFSQRVADNDDAIRRILMQIEVDFLTK